MKIVLFLLIIITFAYLLLLIPDLEPKIPESDIEKTFAWDQNGYWNELEKQFLAAKREGCKPLNNTITESIKTLETRMFQLAPMVAACLDHQNSYIDLFTKLRQVAKKQSIKWDMTQSASKETIYRLLCGGRAAVEEMMLQANPETIPPAVMGVQEPSQTPHASILGVQIHSGDLLLSRGCFCCNAK